MTGVLQRIGSKAPSILADKWSPKLCSTCRQLFRGRRRDKDAGVVVGPYQPAYLVFPQTVQQLEASANSGCHFCRLRWNQLSIDERDALEECTRVTYHIWQTATAGDGVGFDYWTDHRSSSNGSKPEVSRSILIKSQKEIQTGLSPDFDAGPSTSSDAALRAARRWLPTCTRFHSECKRWIRPSSHFMPTRLIDVGHSSKDAPRLCCEADIARNTPYLVLSHYWGGETPLQLKMSNIDDFRRIIKGPIPKTFTDAMDVVRALGQRYLWIDCLCIIQDSKPDWRHEATLMERVYENAWCSLAATAASSNSEGLIYKRDAVMVRPLEIEAQWRPQAAGKYYVWDAHMWDSHVEDAPLLRRGWVTQERVLAPRILHFAKQQLFWECCSQRACEMFPQGIPSHASYKPSMETKWLANTGSTQSLHSPISPLQRFQLWQMHVQTYSDKALTNAQDDKFLAISGIARKIGPASDYIAGLWRSDLHHQLRWSTSEQYTRPQKWRAPSWSWASIDGPVILEPPLSPDLASHTRVVFTLRSADIQLASSDPYGPISDGKLHLQASILHAVTYKSRPDAPSSGPTSVWLDDILCNVTLDTSSIIEGETLFCMPLYTSTQPGRYVIYGIVIQPTSEKGEFERCGVFEIPNQTPDEHWVEKASDAFVEGVQGEVVGEVESVLSGLPWKQYAITLV